MIDSLGDASGDASKGIIDPSLTELEDRVWFGVEGERDVSGRNRGRRTGDLGGDGGSNSWLGVPGRT